jgi:hypothetical protein
MRQQFTRVAAFFPTDPEGRFYLVLVALHAAGAFGAFLMSVICSGVPHAVQRAMLPTAIPSSALQNVTAVQAFRAAYPWSEDREIEWYLWNPYVLIVAFEWLTAGFALCNLWDWLSNPFESILGWLGAGYVAIFFWMVYRGGDEKFCYAMHTFIALSFAASYVVITWVQDYKARSKEQQKADSEQQDASDSTPLTVQGRVWNVPKHVATLKKRPRLASPFGEEPMTDEDKKMLEESAKATGFRYMEYCITAPLLFLAIMALLVTDAPSWLFLIGYWLIQACNAIGISLHFNVTKDMLSKHPGSRWVDGFLQSGTW